MIIKTGRTIYGGEFQYFIAGLVKGRNWLLSQGWQQCPNQRYMQKDGQQFHFNSGGNGNAPHWNNL